MSTPVTLPVTLPRPVTSQGAALHRPPGSPATLSPEPDSNRTDFVRFATKATLLA